LSFSIENIQIARVFRNGLKKLNVSLLKTTQNSREIRKGLKGRSLFALAAHFLFAWHSIS
jgi:hypothetical protein